MDAVDNFLMQMMKGDEQQSQPSPAFGLGQYGPLAGMLGAAQGIGGVGVPQAQPGPGPEPVASPLMSPEDPMSRYAVDLPRVSQHAGAQADVDAELQRQQEEKDQSAGRQYALMQLLSQIPQTGLAVGRLLDGGPRYSRNLSDERAKTDVQSADGAIERFLSALGG